MQPIVINKNGRPRKTYTDDFLYTIAEEYKQMTASKVAERHNVSLSTVRRWIRICKERGVIIRGESETS